MGCVAPLHQVRVRPAAGCLPACLAAAAALRHAALLQVTQVVRGQVDARTLDDEPVGRL